MTQIPYVLGARWEPSLRQRPHLPFFYDPADGLISPRSGQLVNASSTGRFASIDARGHVGWTPVGMLPVESLDLTGDGIRDTTLLHLPDPGVRVAPAYTNDLSNAAWVKTATGSTVLGFTLGDLALWLLTDSDGTNAYTVEQTIPASTFVFTGWRVFGFAVAKGPLPPVSGATRIRLFENGTTERGGATVVFDGNGVPTFTAVGGCTLVCGANGRFLGLGPGGQKVYWQACAVATASHSVPSDVEIAVSSVGGDTGSVYVGCPVVFETLNSDPGPFLVGATSPIAAPDTNWQTSFLALPQAMTLFLRVAPRRAGLPSGGMLLGSNFPRFTISSGVGTGYVAGFHNGSTSVESAIGVAPTYGVLHDLIAVLKADGSCYVAQRVGGVTTVGPTSAAQAMPAHWDDGALYLTAGGMYAGAAIAFGEQTLDFMASFFP